MSLYHCEKRHELFASCISAGELITINITQRKALYSRTVEDRSPSKFASVIGHDDHVYVGSTSGSVFMFASVSGLFIKEIPF